MSAGRLVAIDGHNLLFRMFYGVPAKVYSRDGKLISGVIGFIGAVLRYIRSFQPEYALVVFDSEKPCGRVNAYEGYKSTRRSDFGNCADEENPFSQLAYTKDALDILGVRYCEIDGCEADDVMASYACLQGDLHVYIVSADSDLLQLVKENVTVYVERGKKGVLYDKEKVREKYGIWPESMVDYKALVGDRSDSIPGIPGIGHKTAVKLIETYGGIDRLKEAVLPVALGEKIKNNLALLEANRSLIRLYGQAGLALPLDALKIDCKAYADKRTMGVLRDGKII